jgi:hypothetical protein
MNNITKNGMSLKFLDAQGNELYIGAPCRIVRTHRMFSHDIGRRVVVVSLTSQMAWVYDDKPVTYRINHQGKRVIEHDPRCIQTLHSIEDLELAFDKKD